MKETIVLITTCLCVLIITAKSFSKFPSILMSGIHTSKNIQVDLPEQWEAITTDTLICKKRGNTLIFEFIH